ncbi:MAG TPA: glycosyltransferase [Vicinamibacterales bacterium]|nr:glycosyltransferase [Vicinamibacterales bacterium]
MYVEEPVWSDGEPRIVLSQDNGVIVAVPHLPQRLSAEQQTLVQRQLLAESIREHLPGEYVVWFYTPMALTVAQDLKPVGVVYDCMDELSAFAGAPASLRSHESELFRCADVVFTGGQTLFEAKRTHHPNVHLFPSSVDVAHFAGARRVQGDPADQSAIPRPRIGYFGVIDERMDYELLSGVASARPDWHLILVGPTAKVDPVALPRASNIHYLGAKQYAQLPEYIGGWDVAMLPFARNEATRYISPTKTPEYLAAGKSVVSTSIRDVVRPYGQQGLARIADSVGDFVAAVEAALAEDPVARLRAGDAFLTHLSWDGTWLRMRQLVEQAISDRVTRGAPGARTAS